MIKHREEAAGEHKFVNKDSIVRKIWGKSDTILFIFAGASAEFALNKAVDWLYFTGKLPGDPLGRLFSTVGYARNIVFACEAKARKTIDAMATIHGAVENERGARIPDWAYRDVLFMLIDYSIRAYELLERKLSPDEKQEVVDVFCRLGTQMGVEKLPASYDLWLLMRDGHLKQNLQRSPFTNDLFDQYRKHLGPIRYRLLLEAQMLVVPARVNEMLNFRKWSWLRPFISFYKVSRLVRLDGVFKDLILPEEYKEDIKQMDMAT